jgi:hypothetical protein
MTLLHALNQLLKQKIVQWLICSAPYSERNLILPRLLDVKLSVRRSGTLESERVSKLSNCFTYTPVSFIPQTLHPSERSILHAVCERTRMNRPRVGRLPNLISYFPSQSIATATKAKLRASTPVHTPTQQHHLQAINIPNTTRNMTIDRANILEDTQP